MLGRAAKSAGDLMAVAVMAATMNGVQAARRSLALQLLCLDDGGGQRKLRRFVPMILDDVML